MTVHTPHPLSQVEGGPPAEKLAIESLLAWPDRGKEATVIKLQTYLVVMTTILVALFAGVALAVTASGTDENDHIRGTNSADIIGARGGDDVVSGLGGSDRLYGNAGKDRISGGLGEDELRGGYGNDRLYSADDLRSSRGFSDVVYCGPGRDFASVDRWDRTARDCEEVR